MSDIAELKVPDLWYDVYARLIPGTAFVGLSRLLILGKLDVPSATEVGILAAMGYAVALLTQPFASRLAGGVERLAEQRRKVNRHHVRKIQATLGRGSREAMIISKMHGEVVLFCQLFLLAIVFVVVQLVRLPPHGRWLWWNAGFAVFCGIAAIEVATRRLDRALDEESAVCGIGQPNAR